MKRPAQLPYEVEPQYVARIDYDVKDDYSGRKHAMTKRQRIAFYAKSLTAEHDNTFIETGGSGPCWNAYIIITGKDGNAVEEIAHKTYLYIKRFKGAKFY